MPIIGNNTWNRNSNSNNVIKQFARIRFIKQKPDSFIIWSLPKKYNDSGVFKGKRRVWGGRKEIIAKLYMPTLGAATKHNNRLKAFYDRLVSDGKNKKLALTACMRKLIIWANSILCNKQEWNENFV